ncbi:MAG TPA: hypothetical protein VIF15_18495 [Polyangiaceae bacterium]
MRFALALIPWMLVQTWGCSDEPTHFGRPGGLSGKELPAPEGDAGAVVQPDSGSAPDTGPPAEAGACSVSWSKDLFANMASAGQWQCGSSSCHGGITAPKIASDAPTTYGNLAAYKMKASGLPYILAGSTDPTKSGIECNLSGSCGTRMPITGGGAQQATAAQITAIDTWVKCGAPDN